VKSTDFRVSIIFSTPAFFNADLSSSYSCDSLS
jgi:hypothetical protein